jgi:hypothetical protein
MHADDFDRLASRVREERVAFGAVIWRLEHELVSREAVLTRFLAEPPAPLISPGARTRRKHGNLTRVTPEDAARILTAVLHRDLAYGEEVMPARACRQTGR